MYWRIYCIAEWRDENKNCAQKFVYVTYQRLAQSGRRMILFFHFILQQSGDGIRVVLFYIYFVGICWKIWDFVKFIEQFQFFFLCWQFNFWIGFMVYAFWMQWTNLLMAFSENLIEPDNAIWSSRNWWWKKMVADIFTLMRSVRFFDDKCPTVTQTTS